MALAAGTRLGRYEIVDALGAGGMGEVYRARDTRLDRTVAVKILSGQAGSDAHVRERFDREARAISALSHPHICSLYDAGHHEGTDYLVMELIEGEPLTDRLARGPLPVDQALRTGIEIADALSAAHRVGIVHRDLKPGNVMLTKNGAKLLDFGLARIAPAAGAAGMTALPTTPNLTMAGTILGTFQYMAPEQLEGRESDARSDIFAFGATLFEMLTGRKAFEGKSQASLISSIMSSEPPTVSALRSDAPALDYVVGRCLAKDPDDRWQTARDLAAELKRVAGQSGVGHAPVDTGISGPGPAIAQRHSGRTGWIVAAVMTLVTAAVAVWALLDARAGERSHAPMHLSMPLLPADRLAGMFAFSPDSRRIVFVGQVGDRRQLFIRSLDRPEAVPLAGSDFVSQYGATFSPDGKWLAFVAGGTLQKLSVDGGLAKPLAPAGGSRPSWASDDRILFQTNNRSIGSISASGGEVSPLTTVNATEGEVLHEFPHALPGGQSFVYAVRRADSSTASDGGLSLWVQAIDGSGSRKRLANGTAPAYLPSGHLLFVTGNSLLMAPFDLRGATIQGEPVAVLQGIVVNSLIPYVDVAADGTVAYLRGSVTQADSLLTVVDGQTARHLALPPHLYSDPRLSPDGTRAVVHLFEARDNWVADLRRGTLMRLTFDPGEDETPVWSPDGRWIAYASTREKLPRAIFRKAADGSGAEERLWAGDGHLHLGGFTPDGATLIVSLHDGRQVDLAGISVKDGTLTRLTSSGFDENAPALSRDGRWIAYTSNESGRSEIYVQPYPGMNSKWQVSNTGGEQAMWARDGRALFYRGSGKLMKVNVAGPSFDPSPPQPLFDDLFASTQLNDHTCYDVMPDGKSLLMVTRTGGSEPVSHLRVVLNGLAGAGR